MQYKIQSSALLPALPVVFLLVSFALPPETSVSLGSLRLSPYRLILILLFLPALVQVLQLQRNGFSTADMLMLGHGIWASLALIVTMGLGNSIETAGIYIVETAGAYFIARAYVRTVQDFTAVIRLVFWVTTGLLFFAILESLSGQHLLRSLFQAVMGGPGPHLIEPRLGLTRAFTSFEHPILFGVFAASAFAGVHYLLCQDGRRPMLRRLSIMSATFFSLSGGPYTMLALQVGLISWDKVTAGISSRWTILMSLLAGAWLILTLVSNRSPVLVFISYLTFSASSAYNRVHIWNYGTAEVARHPLFGIGLNDWIRAPWMSSSMDNFWLLTTVRYGVPALICLIGVLLVIGAQYMQLERIDPVLKGARKAWLVTIAGFFLAGLTVHFWNALLVQFCFLIGCGMSLVTATNIQSGMPVTPRTVSMPSSREGLSWT